MNMPLMVLDDAPEMPPEHAEAVRRTWWRLRRLYGVKLPPQRSLIVIEGGRR